MNLSSIKASNSMAMFQLLQTKSQNQIESKPFSQQFDYHLADVPIHRKKRVFVPDGIILVFCPGIREFEVYFRKRAPVEELRKSIEEKIKMSTDKYYIVSKRGVIEPGRTLDDYGISNGDNVVLVEKGVSHNKEIENRNQWIANREKRRENPSTAPIFPLHPIKKPKPTPVKKRKIQKQSSLEAIEDILKSVKLDGLL